MALVPLCIMYTIYIILNHLEIFYERPECFPETLYVQCDGGSENAN
jgi:hypothetical protein